jgi:hypothetical protein
LKAQFALETKITDEIHRDYVALTQLRNLRSSLKELKPSAATRVASSIADLDKKCGEIEGGAGGFGATFLATPAGRGLARLNEGLNSLLGIVDSADAAPTAQATAMFGEVETALNEQLTRWEDVQKKDLPALNVELKKAGLPPVAAK